VPRRTHRHAPAAGALDAGTMLCNLASADAIVPEDEKDRRDAVQAGVDGG